MYLQQKYICTKNKEIIVFPELLQHSEFKKFNPISAGFIRINAIKPDGYAKTTCECYGESVSLNLKSDPGRDTKLAEVQILGNY